MPSFFDPPYQTKLRSVVLPLMTPAKIDPLEPKMRRVCSELISGFKMNGRCDIVDDFARRYPIAIFGDLFGLPTDRREEFRILAETWLHDFEAKQRSWTAIRAIVREELEARREHPRDDMLSGIAHGRIDGELIDLDVGVNLASTVFLGGLDTLPSNIGWTFRYLANHPEARQRIIADPSVIPTAVEEFLRIYTVTAKEQRRATRDIEFHGVHIRAGDRVMGLMSVANQDSAEFEDPFTPNFDRTVNRHMAFAVGAHRCLGSHLARHELQVALQEWHAAIPDYRVALGEPTVYGGGGVFAIDSMHLEWDVPTESRKA